MDPQVIAASFSLLFVMEMGDKTQLAVLSLTARTGKPMAVFAGATLGLAAITLLGVTLGAVAVTLVPGKWVSNGAAIAFVIIGLLMLWAVLRGKDQDDENEGDLIGTLVPRGTMGIAAGTSGLLFVAELGDKSQLAVVGLTGQSGDGLAVFTGAIGALTLVTLLGALAGNAITRVIPLRWLSIGAGVMFVVIGVLTLAGTF